MTFSFLHSTQQESPILIPQIGLTLRVRVPPDMTGAVLTSIETINVPGFGPPLHRHRETEVFYVLEGRYLFEVDGKRFTADTGDVVTAPGESAHTFVNITDKPARQFIQILPGLDAAAFFLELGDAMRNGIPDRDALNAFGAKWPGGFLGPPLHRHRETEVFYVLEGRYLFEVDGKRFTADTGDVVTAPGESAHTFVNITDKPARQFIQILPGLDAAAFFLELGDAMRNGIPDRDALNAFGAKWPGGFLGPPLKVEG